MEHSNNKINYNNNNDIYIKLIKNFENHLISNEKKEAIYNYIKNYTEKNFSNDIIFILEDYNNIISQSIQAIKSLLAENERLNENNINYLQNNLNYSKQQKYSINSNFLNINSKNDDEVDSIRINIQNSKTIDGANLKKPLREIFKSNLNLNKNNNIIINKNIDNNDENKFEIIQKNFKNNVNKNLKMNKSNENIINNSFFETPNINKKEKIEKLKITNEILKKINIMNKNKLYFTNKYIQNSINENNLEENYKNLLNKLINYNLDIRSLIEINSDLIKFQTKNKKNNNNEKPKTNYKSYSPFILEPNESKEFKSNLRIYNNEKTNQKPFLNYTSPYGQLFS